MTAAQDVKRIIVGTTNNLKLLAVGEACAKVGMRAAVSGVKVDSAQNEQPFSLEETFCGALTRAIRAKEKDVGFCEKTIYIGIENGVVDISPNWARFVDLAVVMVLDGKREVSATSTGVAFPADCVIIAKKRGFETTTVGSVIAEKIGCDASDPHSALTHGHLSRQDTFVQALVAALSQL